MSSTSTSHSEVGILAFPPIVHIVWGIILLIGNIAGNMMQVQSTQAWFLGGNADWRLNLNIWSQWPMFLHGQLSSVQTVAFIASWGAQFVLMTSKIGTSFVQAHSAQKHGTSAHNSSTVVKEALVRVGVWNFLAWAIIIIDSATDWGFSNGMGFWQQLFFIAVTFMATFYFGSWGIMNIAAGFNKLKD